MAKKLLTNKLIRNMAKREPQLWSTLVRDQITIAKQRYDTDDETELLENIILPLENYNEIDKLTHHGVEDICYSALELFRRLNSEIKFNELKSQLNKTYNEIEENYKQCVMHTGLHRELRTREDKDNYDRQMQYLGQLQLLEGILNTLK